MDARFLLMVAAGAACTIGGVHFWRHDSPPAIGDVGEGTPSSEQARPEQVGSVASSIGSEEASGRIAIDEPAVARAPRAIARTGEAEDAGGEGDATTSAAGAPLRSGSIPSSRLPLLPFTATREPRVPEVLARAALKRVGVDPTAEATWRAAISDPQLPPEARSDLIEDLNDEGYANVRKPGEADLPLIVARLELIERLAPRETDEVNLAAFREAYKDLLEMYVKARFRLPQR